jgi:PAS domain S-box-containing protein
MSKVACILPDASLSEQAQLVFKDQHDDIHIRTGLLKEAVKISRQLYRDGYEVIISRGMTAAMIEEAEPELSVVKVPFTVLDILQTIERAKFHGKRIGVVAFTPMIMNLDHFDSILGATTRFFPLQNESEVESKVLAAIKDAADIIVGGAIMGRVAQKYGVPFAIIENSPESLQQAAREAKNIAQARKQEKTKSNLFKAVLDYAFDGVISVNADGIITVFNPVAEKYTQVEAIEALGKHIQQVWPELKLEKTLKSCKQDLGQLHVLNNEQVVCNKLPICVNDMVVGAVINFQDVTELLQVEAKVRRSLFASGHIAKHHFQEIIGTSGQLQKTVSLAKDFAKTDSAILIQGETGTGKELFAQSIHNGSRRWNGPFVALNCAALPAQILESELFGYVGGAFTGASHKGKAGLFEIAHGGTLFLDEIAEMEYLTQGKLLRALQEKQVMRLGSDRLTPVDVRIIAATNNPLKQLVSENKFRADLFYRLNVLQLRLYPLRERRDDIIPLASFFLQKHTAGMKHSAEFTQKALNELKRYNWPGNVRELQNVIERILATLKSSKIDIDMIQQHLDTPQENKIISKLRSDETEEIRQALLFTKGNHTEAAKMLGISRSTLWRKLRKTGL